MKRITLLTTFVLLANYLHSQNPIVITYSVSEGTWSSDWSTKKITCNSNLVFKVQNFNPFKYDISLAFNGKEYTSDMPQILKDAFDPSSISGMIDASNNTIKYMSATKAKTTKSADTSAAKDKTMKLQSLSVKDKDYSKLFDGAITLINNDFQTNLKSITDDLDTKKQTLLTNIEYLKTANYNLYLKLLQKVILPDKMPSSTDCSSELTESDNKYSALITSVNALNTEILEFSTLEVKTTDNSAKLKEATSNITDFLTQLKAPLISEVSNYYNLKLQETYFSSMLANLKDGVELQIFYTCSDQLDIDVELVPKNTTLNYNASLPYFVKPYIDSKSTSDSTNKKAASPTKNKTSNIDTNTNSGKSGNYYAPNITMNNWNNGSGSLSKTSKGSDTTKTKASKAKADSSAKPSYLVYKYHIPKHTISLTGKLAYLSFSTGMYVSWLTSDKYTWKNEYAKNASSKDSIRLIKEQKNSSIPEFGILAQAHFVPACLSFTKYNWALGLNFGAGINIPDIRLRYTCGLSAILGKKNQFIISGGLMGGQIDVLSNAYTANMALTPNLKPTDVYTRYWDIKGYFSISYGFRYIKTTTTNPDSKKQ